MLDHFTCYAARRTIRSAAFIPVIGVPLVDAFGSTTMDVRKPVRVCNPANQNGSDPLAPGHPQHLTRYVIARPRHTAPFLKVLHQKVVDQFGTRFVDLIKPVRLMVPSAQSLITSPPAPVNPPIDQFQCYLTRVSTGTPKFTALRGVTTIADQFVTATVDVIRPTVLCVPVDENDEAPGAEAHAAFLQCYKVKAVRGTPRFNKVTPVFVTDHLGSATLDAIRPTEICVPSQRNP
jgi:hypothetical protein